MTPATILQTLLVAGAVTLTGWTWSILLLPSERGGQRMLGFGERAVVSLGLGAIMVPLALLFVSILFRTPISALPAAMTITLLVVVPLPFVWRDVLRVR